MISFINKLKGLFVFLMFLSLACTSRKNPAQNIHLDLEIIDSLFNRYGEKIAIMPCTRCGCFLDAYRKLLRGGTSLKYRLLVDTACNKFQNNIDYIGSSVVDRISDELYNVILFKKVNGVTIYKILDIEDSRNLIKVTDRFFND